MAVRRRRGDGDAIQCRPLEVGGTQLRQLVNNARADSSSDSEPILPVGPFVPIADRSEGGPGTVGPKEVSYEGIETVAGREAPDRFSFQNAQYTAATADEFGVENATDSPIETVTLQYSSERSSLAVEKVNTTYDDVEGETVEIAGRTGRYQERAGERIVPWRCNGRVYSVSGELPREALIDVAESVVCD